MPNSDKNILIVPNTNQNGLPNIQFVGSSSAPISLTVLDDNSLSFSGSQGQLFGINNNLTSGTIYSVNDVSGIPLLELNASGNMTFGQFGGNFSVGKSTANARLDVSGSTVITGSLTVVGTISASSFLGVSGGGGTPGGTNTTVQFNSGSTFSGSSNLVYNYTTNVLSGTIAQFTNLTSSVVSASTYLGLPFANSTFSPVIGSNLNGITRNFLTTYQNTTERTLFVTVNVRSNGGGQAYLFIGPDFASVDGNTAAAVCAAVFPSFASAQNVQSFVPPGYYYKVARGGGSEPSTINEWYEYEIFGGGGDVITTGSNTFTGVNTFNTNFVTASAGITGSIARFGTVTGSNATFSSNVGIGTSTPTSVLHVKSSGEVLKLETTGSTGNNIIRFSNGGGNLGYFGYGSLSNNHLNISNEAASSHITFITNTTERMRITDAGNVGIANDAPASTLSVKGTGTGLVDIGQWTTNNYGSIYLNGDYGTTNNYNIISSPTDKNLYLNRPTGQDIKFRVNNTDQMILDANGNVGINTTSPNARLDVNGNTIITGTLNVTSTTTLTSVSGATAQFTSITGSTFFSASNPSYWTGTAPTNLQDAINRVAAAIFNGITGSIA